MICWVDPVRGREAMGPAPAGWTVEEFAPPGERGRTPSERAQTPGADRVEAVILAGPGEHDLAALSALRLVQTLSAGVDWIIDRVPEGVTVCDAQGTRDAAMAEWVVAAILADYKLARRCAELHMAHRWEHLDDLRDLEGARVLILGYGSIGRALEARLKPFGTEIVRVARAAREGVSAIERLPDLLPAADVIVNLLPLTPQTRGLVGAELLATMRDGALLVNGGRGATVDTDALVAELRSNRIRAALDVVDPEPLPAAHPLWTVPGVVISPHSAGDTIGADRAAWRFAGEQLRRHAAGEPLRNVVSDGY